MELPSRLTARVTGAAAGIGRATVCAADGTAILVTADMSKSDGAAKLIDWSAANFGKNAALSGGIGTRMLNPLGDQSSSVMKGPRHPMDRIGTPQDVADLIVWLCSKQVPVMTGAGIPVDGGYVAQ